MSSPAPLSPTDRFALVIDGLCASVAKQIATRTMTAALIVLVWQRLRRINTRFQALAALIQAGKLRVWRGRFGGTRRPASRDLGDRPHPPTPMPRGFAWLLPLVPSDAACFADGLRRIFAEPEMAALVAATPRMGRILRPLCNMRGIATDFLPAPPPRRRGTAPPNEDAPPNQRPAPAARARAAIPRGRMKFATAEQAIRSDIRPWYDLLAPA